MRLALRELRRRPGRFATAASILTLIAILLMFLGGLLDGLIQTSTGAIEAQEVDVLVYGATSEGSFLRSRIEPEERAAIDALPEVAQTGALSVVQLGARVPGNGPRELANTALWGYELAPAGVPAPPGDGEAYADDTLRASGVTTGQQLLVGPARTPVTVLGFVKNTAYAGQGSLWANTTTWREVVNNNRPDAVLAPEVFQALAVRGADGTSPDQLSAAIEESLDVIAPTVPDAVEAIPGVTEQRGTFNQILSVTLVIALVVIALFFALITVERTALYGVLKAIGARSRTIFGGLVVQAVVVTLIGATIAAVAVVVLDLLIPPGSIPLAISPLRIMSSMTLLLGAAIVGCAFSLRRVLQVDPASALGS
ncbi:MAG: ABC transporter permease [Microthrixaceae bacterium]